MKLNIGCGEFNAPKPWLNVDTVQLGGINPDLIADVFGLPAQVRDLEAVYCGHFLEHIEEHKVVRALSILRERMRPGAPICVVGPDVHRAYDMYLQNQLDERTYQSTKKSPPGHSPEWDGDYHHWDCDESKVADFLRRAEFKNVTAVSINSSLLNDFPVVARDAWQFALLAQA